MPRAKRLPVLRSIFVAALALAGAFQVVRSAAAAKFVDDRLDLAERAWPANPSVAMAMSMSEIGQSAAKRQGASPSSIARAMAAARRAPLRTEPFLIAGAIAVSETRPAQAERLFVEAKRRDPRSSAARYFLAQQYFATRRPLQGLEEASVLTRLVSGGSTALVPGLTQYARAPGAVLNLRRMFAGNRELRDGVLAALASDANNAGLVLALAGSDVGRSSSEVAPAWQGALLKSLVARGDFAQAHALWSRFSGVHPGRTGLFNPQFARLSAPAPFNWSLLSSDFGVAEPAAPGGLQIIYYGRADAELASQLLLLAPGAYELRMQVTRDAENEQPSGLAWSLSCQPGTQRLLALPLVGRAGVARSMIGRFTVPANCPAQLLSLSGSARDFAESEQTVIANLKLIGLARQ